MLNNNENKKSINELRKVMGTLPEQNPKVSYELVKGVEGITVELIDYNVNPYKAMYVMATSCWGKKINKWAETSPENRFLVVKAVLENNALPLALEAPHFTFAIEGLSRAAFDQIARTRVGAVFSAKGMRDNNWKDCSIRIPTALWPNEFDEIEHTDKWANFYNLVSHFTFTKDLYSDIVDMGRGSWQAARTVLPLYVCYGYSVSYHFATLANVCKNRMKFCEMEDTVATAWLMQKEVAKVFPLLGSYLRPGCDFTGKCQYHKMYSMSEVFGCLFKECGRNPCNANNDYAEFNQTCTNYYDLEQQLNIQITKSNEWPLYNSYYDLPECDKTLFAAGYCG